jgi:hypothetical protein
MAGLAQSLVYGLDATVHPPARSGQPRHTVRADTAVK